MSLVVVADELVELVEDVEADLRLFDFAEDFDLDDELLLLADDCFELLVVSEMLLDVLLREDFDSDSSDVNCERVFSDEDDFVLALVEDLLEFVRKTDDEDFELVEDLKLDFELSLSCF